MDDKELRLACLDLAVKVASRTLGDADRDSSAVVRAAGELYDFCVSGRLVQFTTDKDGRERMEFVDAGDMAEPVTDRTNVCGLEQSAEVVFDKENIRGASGIVKFTVIMTHEGHIEIDGLHGASRWRTGIVVPVPR